MSRTRVTAGAALVALLALLLYIPGHTPNFTDPIPGGDYQQFYVAARMVRAGMADELYDLDTQVRYQRDPEAMPYPPSHDSYMLYVYPPFFVWYCLPFSYLPYRDGAIAWMWCMAAYLVAALALLLAAERRLDRFGITLGLALVFTPALVALYSCQNPTLSLLILSATYALLRTGRDFRAGCVFALLAYKPQLTLVIAATLLLAGRWRFVAGVAAVGLVLLGASLLLSPTATVAYSGLGSTLSRWIDMPGMSLYQMDCWQGFWRLLLADSSLRSVQIIALACSLATLGVLVAVLRAAPGPEGLGTRFSALVVTTLLISPHALHYDATLLLLPMVLVVAQARSEQRAFWLPLTIVLYTTAIVSPALAAWTRINFLVLAMLAYLVALARRPPTVRVES